VTHEDVVILVRVLASLVVGAAIGLERTMRGRPAGFRTHALVCVASSLLMLLTVYELKWMTAVPLDAIRTDPTRMAQGIMTGIGFLGAGVIFKDGLSIRGLTTAASIWMTAALGIVIGVGFYGAAVIGASATLAVLAAFRALELRVPTEFYAQHAVAFDRDAVISEDDLRRMLGAHGFSVGSVSYQLKQGGRLFEYGMTIKTRDRRNVEALSRELRSRREVLEFRIAVTGD